jgi:hypothetical protein
VAEKCFSWSRNGIAAQNTSVPKKDPKAPTKWSESPGKSNFSSKNATCGSATTAPKPFVPQKQSGRLRAFSACDTTGQNVYFPQGIPSRKTHSVLSENASE